VALPGGAFPEENHGLSSNGEKGLGDRSKDNYDEKKKERVKRPGGAMHRMGGRGERRLVKRKKFSGAWKKLFAAGEKTFSQKRKGREGGKKPHSKKAHPCQINSPPYLAGGGNFQAWRGEGNGGDLNEFLPGVRTKKRNFVP